MFTHGQTAGEMIAALYGKSLSELRQYPIVKSSRSTFRARKRIAHNMPPAPKDRRLPSRSARLLQVNHALVIIRGRKTVLLGVDIFRNGFAKENDGSKQGFLIMR